MTSRTERKELLVLACEVDRAAWRQACLPNRHPVAQFAHHLMGYVEAIGSFLPGRVGRWIRGANFLANVGRQLGWLRL